MAKYIIKRTLAAIPMVLIITVICFTLMNLAPYDAIDAMTSPKMPPETVALIKAKYGYDQPVYIQYLRWVDGMLNGNFGYSIVTHQSISTDLAVRLPNTIKLILPAYLLSYALAIVLGLLAGSHKNRWVDKLIDGLSAVGIALPTFWVAMLLIYFLGYRLKLLPIVGMHTIGKEGSVGDFFKHFIMPFSALFLSFLPDAVRYVRSSTITQYSEDYVLVQQAFGASKAEIMFKHVCKNVLLPIITKLGMALPMLVTGAIITETIFGWPGVGPYFVKAIQGMDYPIVMVILGNLLSDILYCLTDPRIKDLG